MKVTICDKEYEIRSSALTPFLYKKTFGVGIMEDVSKLTEYNDIIERVRKENEGKEEEEIQKEINKAVTRDLNNLVEIPLQLAYIFIKTANKDFMSFDNWLDSMSYIDMDGNWLSEVTELAVNSFHRQGTNGTTETH